MGIRQLRTHPTKCSPGEKNGLRGENRARVDHTHQTKIRNPSGSGVVDENIRILRLSAGQKAHRERWACPLEIPVKSLELVKAGGQTLGFAFARGLIRGLTRYPNPSSRFYSTTHFWESVLCLTVDTSCVLDPVHTGVVGRGQPWKGECSPTPSSPNMGTLWMWSTVAMTAHRQDLSYQNL